MTGTRAVIAAMGALLLGVTACSGSDPEPRVAPPSSSAPSSPSTSPTADLGPEASVLEWVDARNYALETGDLRRVRALTAPSCKSCEGVLNPIERVYSNGGSFDTDGWTVAASRVKKQTQDTATVPTGLTFAGGTTVSEAGADPVVYTQEKHIVVFKLINVDGRWLVDFVGFLS